MKSHVIPFLCLATLFGAASGLTLEGVRLVDNREYISYGLGPAANNSLLECVYHLDDAEKVDQVVWEMLGDGDGSGYYIWRPDKGGYATGNLSGVVKQDRTDSSLELTELRYDLGGNYSCSVSLTNNVTVTSGKEEVLIVDIIGKDSLWEDFQKCGYTTSYQSWTVFPEETLQAGMFSPKLSKYYEEVPSQEWEKTVYDNGSVAHSYKDVSFTITEKTPDDIVFKMTKGIYKADLDYISLGDLTASHSTWYELGCPDVKEDTKTVHYVPEDSTTCRGGRRNTTTATVTCRSGYHAEGDVSEVTLRCSGPSLTWEPEPGHTATLGDLVCVKGTETTTANPGGGASSGYLSLVLFLASLLGVVVRLFSHP